MQAWDRGPAVAVRTTTPDWRVADQLDALAKERASGAIEIDGSPGGRIFLEDGRITFAVSPAAPDLSARLIGSGRLSGEQWGQLVRDSHPYSGVGALLVERGFVTKDDLQILLRSVVLDTMMALTAASVTAPVMRGIRFTPLAWHWAGSLLRLDPASARAELERGTGRPARHDVSPVARPRLCDLHACGAVVTGEQWMLAGKIDGVASIQDLAWENGLALYDTMERVAELADAGLCTLNVRGQPTRPAPAAGPPLPRRTPGAVWAQPDGATRGDLPQRHKTRPALPAPALPSPELLRQVLDGLRRLGLERTLGHRPQEGHPRRTAA